MKNIDAVVIGLQRLGLPPDKIEALKKDVFAHDPTACLTEVPPGQEEEIIVATMNMFSLPDDQAMQVVDKLEDTQKARHALN